MQEFTNTENEKKFIGVWKLDEWSVEKPNGNKTYPFAGDVSGYLMYHADGWMTANLMQKSRKKVSDDRVKISKISHILKNETEISFEGERNSGCVNDQSEPFIYSLNQIEQELA